MRKKEREILTHEFNIGDLVRWMDEFDTFHYGSVAAIDGMSIQVAYGSGGKNAKLLLDATELSLADDIKGKQRFTKTELKAKAAELAETKGWTEMLAMWDDEKKPGEPARRVDVRKVDASDYAGRIVQIILDAGEFMGAADIKAKLDDELSAAAWNKAIDEALRGGKIVKTGKRRGTMYGPIGVEAKPTVKKAAEAPQDVVAYGELIVNFLEGWKVGSPDVGAGKSDIVNAVGDSPLYTPAIKMLLGSETIVKTGAKRGTKYHV